MNRFEFILDRAAGHQVLHVGCADWPYTAARIERGRLLHQRLLKRASRVVGTDTSREAIAIMKANGCGDDVFLVPDEIERVIALAPFDIIVATEVIEHVNDATAFLDELKRCMSPSTKLYLTTPNAQSIKSAIRGLFGREFCHPDHLAVHSTTTLTTVLERVGYRVTNRWYYWSPPTTWFGKVAQVPVLPLRWLCSQRGADGIIMEACPS